MYRNPLDLFVCGADLWVMRSTTSDALDLRAGAFGTISETRTTVPMRQLQVALKLVF